MAYEFRLPDIGEGLHEAEVLQWFVKVGDDIKADQPVVEVQTDKAAVEIASPVGGRVSILGGEPGDTIKVGEVLIAVDTEVAGTTAEARAEVALTNTLSAPVQAAPAASNVQAAPVATDAQAAPAASNVQAGSAGRKRRVQAAPAVRKLAHDLGVDLETVEPSDKSGRVTRADVERAVALAKQQEQGTASAITAQPAVGTGQAPAAAPAAAMAQSPAHTPTQSQAPTASQPITVSPAPFVGQGAGSLQATPPDRREPIRGLRKRIYQNMAKSMYTAPQATGMDDLDATRLVELRQRLMPHAQARGIRLTYLPIIIKAVTYVLREYPIFNASVDDEQMEIVYKGGINIGIATATPEGLLVPVIRDADKKSVFQIAAELDDLIARGRDRKLQISELTGSTFTITSTGPQGGWFATPIVNYPEVAILGVHSIQKRAVVLEDDSIVPQQRMTFSLTFDHRVIDGEPAGRFMYRFREYLENPELMIAL